MKKKSLYIPENEKAELFTYFNGFYPGQWSEYTELNGLHVEVTVSGNCKVALCYTDGKKCCIRGTKMYHRGDTASFEMPDPEKFSAVWIRVEGLEQGCYLRNIVFGSEVEVQQDVQIAVVICTCRREKR